MLVVHTRLHMMFFEDADIDAARKAKQETPELHNAGIETMKDAPKGAIEFGILYNR